MRFPLFALMLLFAGAASGPARAQLHKVIPWIHRAEPAVERVVFLRSPDLRIVGSRVGILPFASRQEGEPAPPPFAPFVRQAISRLGTGRPLVEIPDPAAEVPEAERPRFGGEGRIALALDRSKAAGVDLLAAGAVDALFRTSSGGMVIKVSAELWDVDSRAPVWSGRLTVDWSRRYTLEDCMLRAAIALVEEWDSAAPRK